MPDGTAGRDMGIGRDGKPIYVTRASQAEVGGPWEMIEPAPPGTPEYQENWAKAF